MQRKLWLLALVGAMLLSVTPVLADGDFYVIAGGGGVGTKITSLPYTINSPGFYYLGGNLTRPSGPGITINTNDVTLDLMGFTLSGTLSPGRNQNYAIYMSGRKNVEIRNGSLIGWDCAINAESTCANNRVINVRAENNYGGIHLVGYGNLVKGCTLSDNLYSGVDVAAGGGATITGNVISNNGSEGIWVGGIATITGNLVSNSQYVIILYGAGSLIGNTVSCGSNQTGISLTGNGPVMLDQNTVTGVGTPFSPGSASYVKGTNAGF
jgi:parallel beta-helix repeat protein